MGQKAALRGKSVVSYLAGRLFGRISRGPPTVTTIRGVTLIRGVVSYLGGLLFLGCNVVLVFPPVNVAVWKCLPLFTGAIFSVCVFRTGEHNAQYFASRTLQNVFRRYHVEHTALFEHMCAERIVRKVLW